MNEEHLNKKYNNIINNDNYKRFVINQCKLQMETKNYDKIYMAIRDETVPEFAKICVIDFIIDNHISSIYMYTINYACSIKDKPSRNRIFNYTIKEFINNNLINDEIIDRIIYMNIIRDTKISHDLLKLMHDKYGQSFFKKNFRRFETVRQYCYTFNDQLNDYEKETLFKKLHAKTRLEYIDVSLKRVNFSEKQQKELLSLKVLHQLHM